MCAIDMPTCRYNFVEVVRYYTHHTCKFYIVLEHICLSATPELERFLNLFVCQVCFVDWLAFLRLILWSPVELAPWGIPFHPFSLWGGACAIPPSGKQALFTALNALPSLGRTQHRKRSRNIESNKLRKNSLWSICIQLHPFAMLLWLLTSDFNAPCDFTTHGLSCVKFCFWHGGTPALPGLFGCFGFSPEQSNSTTCTSPNSSPLPTSIPNTLW
jgi:hypothetical protein